MAASESGRTKLTLFERLCWPNEQMKARLENLKKGMALK